MLTKEKKALKKSLKDPREMVIIGFLKEMCKINMEHLAIPASKEAFGRYQGFSLFLTFYIRLEYSQLTKCCDNFK